MIQDTPAVGNQHLSATALALFLSILLGLVAISDQSLWIDEANTAVIAMANSFADFQVGLKNDKGSTMQMPFYMAALWGWVKLFGSSEFTLRTFNLPFFVLALLAVTKCMELPRIQKVFLVLFACFSPFLWAYLDEARPYILQFCGAVLPTVGLWNTAQPWNPKIGARLPLRELILFSVGILILCGSSLIGVIYSFFFGIAFLIAWLRRESISAILKRADLWVVAGLSAVFLAALGGYYFWTLQIGAKASGVGKTNPLSIGFAVYEFLGFAGLGPSRAELRENPLAAIKAHLPFLAGSAVICGAFFLMGANQLLRRTTKIGKTSANKIFPILLLGATAIVCAAFIILLGIFGEFRIVGRHFMPLLPFFLLLLSILSAALWESDKKLHRGAVGSILLVSLASSLAFRFSPTHAKDDYRSAAAAAVETLNSGGVVWWAADPAGAEYYGLPKMSRGIPFHWSGSETARVIIVSNLADADLSKLPTPNLVLLSKQDIYDSAGSIIRYLQANSIQLDRNRVPAFSFAHKPTSSQ